MKPPIFLVSSARAGSTLVRRILNAHPAIYCPGELYLGRFARAVYHAAYWTAEAADDDERDARALAFVVDSADRLLGEAARRRGKQMWCEKSPVNTEELGLLQRAFPAARFVWLHRDALDVAHSCLETGWMDRLFPDLAEYVRREPDNLPAAMLRYWTEKNRKILEAEQRNGSQFLRIRYENVTSATEATLHELFDELGVEWTPRILTEAFSGVQEPGIGDRKLELTRSVHGRSIGKGSRFRREQFPPDLLEEADRLCGELGRPPIGQARRADGVDVAGTEPTAVAAESGRSLADIRSLLPKLTPGSGDAQRVALDVDGRRWTADLAEGTWRPGEQADSVDAAIFLSAGDLAGILEGSANPADLFAGGRIRVEGDLGAAQRLAGALVPPTGDREG